MKKILLYLLLLSSCLAGAQAIVVPDANFKAKLLEADATNNIAKDSSGDSIEIDTNYDGVISQDEAEEVRELYVATSNIASLSGIEYFTNLRILDCSHNSIASFDATSNEDLRSLFCYNNGMTSLLVNDLSHLEVLNCISNMLTSLDLTGADSLQDLNCASNNITALVLTNLEYLEILKCSYNQLETLDLSGNTNLEQIACFNNPSLKTIFMKNGKIEDILEPLWMGNPSLEYICADEYQIGGLITDVTMPANVQINSYCSYEPGGIYNRIVGTVRFDANNNGYGTDDYAIPSFRLKINEGGFEDTIFTKPDGSYVFYVGAGTYTVTPMFENDYFTATPADAYVNFAILTGVQETKNFSISSNGVAHNDVEAVMAPVTTAQPGFNAVYKMVYKNKGNQIIPFGDVTCYWDSSRLGYVDVSEPISGMGPDTYTWNYYDLKPFESREIEMTLSVNSSTDTPAVNIGDILDFNISINPGTDDVPGDNSFDFNQVVEGAFDPNNIVCVEGSTASPDNIGDYLHYIVNFENTGTVPVNFVVVQMDIDPDQFDLTTFSLINSSAGTTVRTTGNRVEIRFDNIMMAVDGNGNLLYKIKSRNGLLAGDSVSSKVNIYFDYNFPVETNPAITTFDVLGLDDFDKDNSVVVYPNPSKDIVNVNATDSMIKSIQLYDIQGRLLQTGIVNEASLSLDLSGRASGIYILKINTEKGIKVEKLIRE